MILIIPNTSTHLHGKPIRTGVESPSPFFKTKNMKNFKLVLVSILMIVFALAWKK